MIFSHVGHAWGGAEVRLDRALSPSWILRRVAIRGVLDDERPVASTIGWGVTETRGRLTVVLAGRLLVWVGSHAWEVGPGEAMLVSPLSDARSLGEGYTVVELDWNGAGQPFAAKLRLPVDALTAAQALAELLTDTRSGSGTRLTSTAGQLLAPLAAEGLAVPRGGDLRETDPLSVAAQLLMTALDEATGNLEQSPQSVDLEARLGCSRWTLTRLLHRLHTTYGLHGTGRGTDWRSLRDFMRLRIAVMLMTHPRASTRAIAGYVGYRSPDAMCHAFANAGFPSPARVRTSILASL